MEALPTDGPGWTKISWLALASSVSACSGIAAGYILFHAAASYDQRHFASSLVIACAFVALLNVVVAAFGLRLTGGSGSGRRFAVGLALSAMALLMCGADLMFFGMD